MPVLTCLFRMLECVGDAGAGTHDVQRIDDWLTGSTYRSATDASRRVEELRLSGTMTGEQRRRTVRYVIRGADRPV